MAHLSPNNALRRRRFRDGLAQWLVRRISPHFFADYRERLAASNARVQAIQEELQTEEMRVRRLVSDRLHGALQNRMVGITAGMDGLARRLRNKGDITLAQELDTLAWELDTLREHEVRDLAHTLFPAGIELGTVRAIEAMVYRLPPQIQTTLTMGPHLAELVKGGGPFMPLAERLVVVTAVEEAITNALKHGGATALALNMELDASGPGGAPEFRVTIADNGRGLDPARFPAGGVDGPDVTAALERIRGGAARDESGAGSTGFTRHVERVQMRGGSLRVWSPARAVVPFSSGGTGAQVEITLPLPKQ